MESNSRDEEELSQLWPNVVSMLILAFLAVSLLALSPWGIDVLYSSVTHFLMFWPLFLLVVITYVAWKKLAEPEKEIPGR